MALQAKIRSLNSSPIPSRYGRAFRAAKPSRRLSSRSIASRMNSARRSLSRKMASIRLSVPAGRRAGVSSSLILGRPATMDKKFRYH